MKNTPNKRKIIVDADTNEGRDILRYDAWTVARVVEWARVKHRVAASPHGKKSISTARIALYYGSHTI